MGLSFVHVMVRLRGGGKMTRKEKQRERESVIDRQKQRREVLRERVLIGIENKEEKGEDRWQRKKDEKETTTREGKV